MLFYKRVGMKFIAIWWPFHLNPGGSGWDWGFSSLFLTFSGHSIPRETHRPDCGNHEFIWLDSFRGGQLKQLVACWRCFQRTSPINTQRVTLFQSHHRSLLSKKLQFKMNHAWLVLCQEVPLGSSLSHGLRFLQTASNGSTPNSNDSLPCFH